MLTSVLEIIIFAIEEHQSYANVSLYSFYDVAKQLKVLCVQFSNDDVSKQPVQTCHSKLLDFLRKLTKVENFDVRIVTTKPDVTSSRLTSSTLLRRCEQFRESR